jgi:HAD superfamily hydrolase (TIGR01509 family)
MTLIRNISAVFFDMDGTLVDTELLNEPVIRSVCAEAGVHCPDFDWTRFYGVSWNDIARQVAGAVDGQLDVAGTAREFHRKYEELCAAEPPPAIPGARKAVVDAHAIVPTGVVSSSYRSAIDTTIKQLQLSDYVTCRVGADDYANSKPAPDSYLHAARLLGVDPLKCLVFEDSIAGMRSALTAGMRVVAVTHRSNASPSELEDANETIADYTELGAEFFTHVKMTE